MDGIDEDHCEEVEYNECEENEYRCEDGSCIPEQYWLDATYDCSDQTDEMSFSTAFQWYQPLCSLTSSHFACDETKVRRKYFACGDGQSIDDLLSSSAECYNYRDVTFFCEFSDFNAGMPTYSMSLVVLPVFVLLLKCFWF